MYKKILIVLLALVFSLCVVPAHEVKAQRATQEEMERVCKNWLSYLVYQRGAWAGATRPQIEKIDKIIEGDTVLARCFSISPRGFVVVPILKELPPIKAYSEEYGLDVNQRVGFPQLLREVLLDRIRLYLRIYGSLDAVQPPIGDVLLGRGHKAEWNRFLKSEKEFKTDLTRGKFKALTEVGPLLTTSWYQYAPYNNFCPMGDQDCEVCPNGKPPTFPTKVGCVAVATAQIMKYWNWPPSGTGSHSYMWYGDYSCGGSTPTQELTANFSDPYDWQNMPDSCDTGCSQEEQEALAELCYEVGVALEMDYGVCGSGTMTFFALDVFRTYFRYGPSIDLESRHDHTPTEWFSIIQTEIDEGRPIQYRIYRHSIVCDGWRDTGGLNQYHMNYGWGGPFTAWYSIDSLYCYWVLPDSLCPPMEEYLIRYISPIESTPFAPAVNYDVGDASWSVFCADLDGDLDLDLAVGKYFSTSISILKNNGDGTFQTKVDYGVGDGPHSVFCADLDGDLDLDLAVTNPSYLSSNVSILKNNGDGTFQPKVDYGAGYSPYFVFCADLDGDDDLDLAVANHTYGSGTVSILKNTGDGTFQLDSSYEAGNSPYSVFCADLDGDLDLDIAVANEWSGNVSILKNNGDGTFQSAVNYEAGDYPASVFCADLDGDSDLDLASGEFGGQVSVLKNNGNGTFQTKVDYTAGISPVSVFCADLDGDSDLDLATANSGLVKTSLHTVSMLRNNGDGTFQPKVDYATGECPVSVFCADLDGDSDLDLAVANYGSDSVSILENLSQVSANQPPNSFSLLSPTDGDSVCTPVTLDWQTPYDPNFGDQIRYDLYVSTVPDFDPDSTIIYDSLGASRLTDTLDIHSYYYWKVKAYDNWGTERWSNQTWSFYVSLRGDANGDGTIDIADISYLINYLFLGTSPPQPLDAGDANCDGVVDIADVMYLINYLFIGGSPPNCE